MKKAVRPLALAALLGIGWCASIVLFACGAVIEQLEGDEA